MSKPGTPSAVPLTWAVVRPSAGLLLGYVSDRMWFEARKKACAEFGVGPDQIELEAIGPTSELPPLPRPDRLLVAPAAVQDKSKLRKGRRKGRRRK